MIEQIEKTPLYEIVYEKLKAGILDGDFRPQERLNQAVLAEQLGVSRMPIRDALRQLEYDNLVENQPEKGYVVATFSQEKVNDIMTVRQILEPRAVIMAMENVTAEDIRKLETILSGSWEALEQEDWKTVVALNHEFHFTIYNKACSPLLSEIILKLWQSFPKYLVHEHSRRSSLMAHQRILDYMKQNNYVAAAAEMEKHIHT